MSGELRATDHAIRARLDDALARYGGQPVSMDIADVLVPVVRRIANEERQQFAAAVLRAAAKEQRNEADHVPDTDVGTHADGHRCAADFLDRRADALARTSGSNGGSTAGAS